MKFPLSVRIRSLRSAAKDNEFAARIKRKANLRNLHIYSFRLLFRYCFLPLADGRLLVRK